MQPPRGLLLVSLMVELLLVPGRLLMGMPRIPDLDMTHYYGLSLFTGLPLLLLSLWVSLRAAQNRLQAWLQLACLVGLVILATLMINPTDDEEVMLVTMILLLSRVPAMIYMLWSFLRLVRS